MLNLSEEALPKYEFMFEETNYEFDPLELAFAAESVENIKNPVAVKKIMNEATGLELSSFQAMTLLFDCMKFIEEHAAEKLKNFFSPLQSSPIISDSPQKSVENSDQASTSDS